MTKTYHRRREYKQIQHDKTRKAKIQYCPKCKRAWDASGRYPDFFIFYAAPKEVCKECRE